MRNNSPVYDADTLRTADSSEATIFFDDGTSLDMLENSMLKLDFGQKTKNLQFLTGQISVGSSQGKSSYTISSTAGKITVDKGAKATFSRDADKVSVNVSSGTAHLVKADGTTQVIARNQELQVDTKSGKATLIILPLVTVSPERNSRLLSFTNAAQVSVDFAWQHTATASDQGTANSKLTYTLELSQEKDLATDVISKTEEGLGTQLNLAAGIWYWRVRDSRGQVSPTSRFSLDVAAAPQPVFPADGQTYGYRRVKPSVPFSWTPMDQASSYLLEISSDRQFTKPQIRQRTTTSNLSIDSLSEGTWFWRVSPVHALTVIGAVPTAQVRSFVIQKKSSMETLEPRAPLDASLYAIQDIDGKGLDFAWDPNQEAVSYELVVSLSKDLSSPLHTWTTASTHLHLQGNSALELKNVGTYFWGIRWTDREGNISPLSAARQIAGIDGSVAVNLSFPPDGYRAADSLIQDTRFAWKSNVNARTVFQVSHDADFQNLVYKEVVNSDTLIGHSWKTGAYLWRLVAYKTDGSLLLKTEPRRFDVVDPFPSPQLVNPPPNGTNYLREHDSTTISWNPVAGADYYTVALRAGDDTAPMLQRNFITGTSITEPLGNLPQGTYHLTIQAFAASGEKTTRIIGYLSNNTYTQKLVTAIHLVAPLDGAHVAGLDARQGKTDFRYSLEERPASAEVEVSTDADGNNVIARSLSTSGLTGVGRLNPGTYYWTVVGHLGDLDVSSPQRFHFVVDPPPPPPAAALKFPLDGTLYLTSNAGQDWDFSCEPQPHAASYELLVSASEDLSSPLLRFVSTQPHIRLSTDQARFLKTPASYYWGIRWTNTDGDVSLLSAARVIEGVNAATALVPQAPLDQYRIAALLLNQTPFRWTAPVHGRTLFQVSADPAFSNLTDEVQTHGGTLNGGDWKPSHYYWRLQTYNADGSLFLTSSARRFEVVPPLPAPVVVAPASGASLTLREHDTAKVTWQTVAGADSYEVTLLSATNTAAAVSKMSDLQGTSAEAPLGDLPGGAYRVAVRAFAAATPLSTPMVGLTTTVPVSFKKLFYLTQTSPAAGDHVSGLDAHRSKLEFVYGAHGLPDQAVVVILPDKPGAAPLFRVPNLTGRTTVGKLLPGKYVWTIEGQQLGFDIPALSPVPFVVDPPPSLPAPLPVAPADNTVIGPAELRQQRSISFSWKPVGGATRYRFTVYRSDGLTPLFVEDKISSTHYKLTDLDKLLPGLLFWSVEAQSYDTEGELEQPGVVAKTPFTVDVPSVKKAQTSVDKSFYGD